MCARGGHVYKGGLGHWLVKYFNVSASWGGRPICCDCET